MHCHVTMQDVDTVADPAIAVTSLYSQHVSAAEERLIIPTLGPKLTMSDVT